MQILWRQQQILATYPCKLPTCHSALNAEVMGQFNHTSVNTASILQCRQKYGKWRQLVGDTVSVIYCIDGLRKTTLALHKNKNNNLGMYDSCGTEFKHRNENE